MAKMRPERDLMRPGTRAIRSCLTSSWIASSPSQIPNTAPAKFLSAMGGLGVPLATVSSVPPGVQRRTYSSPVLMSLK